MFPVHLAHAEQVVVVEGGVAQGEQPVVCGDGLVEVAREAQGIAARRRTEVMSLRWVAFRFEIDRMRTFIFNVCCFCLVWTSKSLILRR